MTRPAMYSFDPNISIIWTDWNTIITRFNNRILNRNSSRLRYMDTISIRAISIRRNCNPCHIYILACINRNVKHLAIDWCQTINKYVLRVVKTQGLLQNKRKNKINEKEIDEFVCTKLKIITYIHDVDRKKHKNYYKMEVALLIATPYIQENIRTYIYEVADLSNDMGGSGHL